MNYFHPWRKDFRYFIKHYAGCLSIDENISKMLRHIFSSKQLNGLRGEFWQQFGYSRFKNGELKRILYRKIITSQRTLESLFKIFIEETTRYLGYTRCAVKFPLYFNYTAKLLGWYPDCKLVHISRDPRAIAMSKTNDPGGAFKFKEKYPVFKPTIRKSVISMTVFNYNWSSRVHKRLKWEKNYSLFKYEDLLYSPEKVIRDLCQFCEIDFSERMLSPKNGQPSSLTEKKSNGFNRQAASRWEKVISSVENRVITRLSKGSMQQMGYGPNDLNIFKNLM